MDSMSCSDAALGYPHGCWPVNIDDPVGTQSCWHCGDSHLPPYRVGCLSMYPSRGSELCCCLDHHLGEARSFHQDVGRRKLPASGDGYGYVLVPEQHTDDLIHISGEIIAWVGAFA